MHEDIYRKMLTETLDGFSLNDLVGGGDPQTVGEAVFRFLHAQQLIAPDSNVLEIGSGCGRGALSIAEFLSTGKGGYTGIDIIPQLVEFTRREITPIYPKARFYVDAQSNPLYDKYIGRLADETLYIEDYFTKAGPFDLVSAMSVFTHLDEAEARQMLSNIYRSLKPGGAAVLSFFVIDEFAREQVRLGHTQYFRAGVRPDGVSEDNFNGPRSAVGFDDRLLREMLLDAGFEGIFAQFNGLWRSTPGTSFQDLLVVKRAHALPAEFDSEAYLDAHADIRASGMRAAFHYRAYGRAEGRVLSRVEPVG